MIEGAGLRPFFDRSDLTEISMEALRASVASSAVIVTILDPFTFDSEWVAKARHIARKALCSSCRYFPPCTMLYI